jgi:hypothetical protein
MKMDTMNGSKMRTSGSKTFTGNSESNTAWPFKYVNGVQTEASKVLMVQKHVKAKQTLEDYEDATF